MAKQKQKIPTTYSPKLMDKVLGVVNGIGKGATINEVKHSLHTAIYKESYEIENVTLDDLRNICEELARQGKLTSTLVQTNIKVYLPPRYATPVSTSNTATSNLSSEDDEDEVTDAESIEELENDED